MRYGSDDCPPYMVTYDTVCRTCEEQRKIIEEATDRTVSSFALKGLPRLIEAGIHFRMTVKGQKWLELYPCFSQMTMRTKSLEHHIRVNAIGHERMLGVGSHSSAELDASCSISGTNSFIEVTSRICAIYYAPTTVARPIAYLKNAVPRIAPRVMLEIEILCQWFNREHRLLHSFINESSLCTHAMHMHPVGAVLAMLVKVLI
ncbi:hypothetical protein OIDMADRAFT_60888 [Oidiodendron maius Zn]|uniref:Uncharacterized protein n=1 Tax=Oidiodendron maius (strain Zn) TaxID=913774 RepID=A0A0C3GRS4_OIDMZ|nr:hypothetical protein OIDMADRAFT_60888 [Oidiodendron maius Zn]